MKVKDNSLLLCVSTKFFMLIYQHIWFSFDAGDARNEPNQTHETCAEFMSYNVLSAEYRMMPAVRLWICDHTQRIPYIMASVYIFGRDILDGEMVSNSQQKSRLIISTFCIGSGTQGLRKSCTILKDKVFLQLSEIHCKCYLSYTVDGDKQRQTCAMCISSYTITLSFLLVSSLCYASRQKEHDEHGKYRKCPTLDMFQQGRVNDVVSPPKFTNWRQLVPFSPWGWHITVSVSETCRFSIYTSWRKLHFQKQ